MRYRDYVVYVKQTTRGVVKRFPPDVNSMQFCPKDRGTDISRNLISIVYCKTAVPQVR